jgi:hypothetical protein
MREAGVRPDLYSYNTLLSACAAAAADARLPPRVGLRAVEQMREAFGVAPSAEVARARRRGPRPPNRRICAYNGGLAARSPPPAAHRHLLRGAQVFLELVEACDRAQARPLPSPFGGAGAPGRTDLRTKTFGEGRSARRNRAR